VLDVGGGSSPTIRPEIVRELGLFVVGLDISAERLQRAPAGAYQDVIVGDVATVRLSGPFDLVLSNAVLEHVDDVAAAIGNMAGALSENGLMAHFAPCRNAPFAIINRLLGDRLARRVLLGLHPERAAIAGFPARYDRCVPSSLRAICRRSGLEVVELRPYYVSEYFEFCFPLHVLDLLRQCVLAAVRWPDLAETFTIVARKAQSAPPAQIIDARKSNTCPGCAILERMDGRIFH
jgi:SAM-dependent methyltransferase